MSRSQDWVRIADAARVTGIPARTIRWWAARGSIPYVQIGGPRTWLLVYLPALTLPTRKPERPLGPEVAGSMAPASLSSG